MAVISETITKDLGAVSAYAVAVANGFVGTEAQWEEYIANASTNAVTASAKAQVAEGFAVGEQNGSPVGASSPYFENNAEHWASVAQDIADSLGGDIETAVDNWLDEHPEATTTVQDDSLTPIKLAQTFKKEIISLSSFTGNNDAEKLYDALITQSHKGTILGGDITINNSIELPNAQLREVKIANAVITLNDDLFSAEADSFARIPSFINCTFIGNGNAIFKEGYVVCGSFVDCVFKNCSIINDSAGTIQSAYLTNCEITNTTVPLIRVKNLYDVHISGAICEAQTATLIDTYGSPTRDGGTLNLFITNSTFEGFTEKIFKLSGGNIFIRNCYFEGNTDGCLLIQKTTDADPAVYNYLHFELSGNKINSPVNAFVISGYTSAKTVVISVHDNQYYSSNNSSALISGVAGENLFAIYNNSLKNTSNIICSDNLPIYEPYKLFFPTEDNTKAIATGGGIIQFGTLVFIDMIIRAKTTSNNDVINALTGMPHPRTSAVRIPLRSVNVSDTSTNDSELTKSIYILNNGNTIIQGGITTDEKYRIRGFYFTNNKVIS